MGSDAIPAEITSNTMIEAEKGTIGIEKLFMINRISLCLIFIFRNGQV